MTTPTYLTTEEAARVMSVSAWTVRDYVRRGLLRGMKPPGTRSYRIARDDLDKFMARGATRRSQPA